MTKNPVILVSGPTIAKGAVELARKAGCKLIFAPAYCDAETLSALITQTNPIGIVSRAGLLGGDAMRASNALEIVSKHGAGVDNIDVDAATKLGIQVIRATGANAVSVAEHTVALTMAVVKQLRPLDQKLRGGIWEKMGFVGREMAGMRVGLVGAGAIAQAAARLFRGIGVNVAAYDPYANSDIFENMGVERFETIEDMLATVDIVCLHCPLTIKTRHILNAETLALLRKGSYVINAARGGLIDETALLAALNCGHIAGAGLDVIEDEPITAANPLFDARNVIVTPHIGASTLEAMERVAIEAIQGILDYTNGREVAANRLVNKINRKKSVADLEN